MADDTSRQITFVYNNWRGESAIRKVIPIKIWYGSTEWHPTEQWFLQATDVDKADIRDFALLDICFEGSKKHEG